MTDTSEIYVQLVGRMLRIDGGNPPIQRWDVIFQVVGVELGVGDYSSTTAYNSMTEDTHTTIVLLTLLGDDGKVATWGFLQEDIDKLIETGAGVDNSRFLNLRLL